MATIDIGSVAGHNEILRNVDTLLHAQMRWSRSPVICNSSTLFFIKVYRIDFMFQTDPNYATAPSTARSGSM